MANLESEYQRTWLNKVVCSQLPEIKLQKTQCERWLPRKKIQQSQPWVITGGCDWIGILLMKITREHDSKENWLMVIIRGHGSRVQPMKITVEYNLRESRPRVITRDQSSTDTYLTDMNTELNEKSLKACHWR